MPNHSSNLLTDKAHETQETVQNMGLPYASVQTDFAAQIDRDFAELAQMAQDRRERVYPAGRWKRVDPEMGIPFHPGCYAITDGRTAFYVGQSSSIAERIRQHGWRESRAGVRTQWGFLPGASIKVRLGRSAGEHLSAEARLIDRLRPKFNKRPGVARSRKAPKSKTALPKIQYRSTAGEGLISLSDVANRFQIPLTVAREMLSEHVIEAVPVGLLDAALDQLQG